MFSKQRLKLARKVGLNEVEEDDLGVVIGVDRRGAQDLEKQQRQLEEAVEAGTTDEGDDHQDSPGVQWAAAQNPRLYGEYGPGFRKVWTKEAADDGHNGLLRGPAVPEEEESYADHPGLLFQEEEILPP